MFYIYIWIWILMDIPEDIYIYTSSHEAVPIERSLGGVFN